MSDKSSLTHEVHRILNEHLDGKVYDIELSPSYKNKPSFFRIPIRYLGTKYYVMGVTAIGLGTIATILYSNWIRYTDMDKK